MTSSPRFTRARIVKNMIGFGPGGDHDLLGAHGDPPGLRHVRGNRFPKLGKAGGGTVVGRPGVEGALGRLLDVGGRVEPGLATPRGDALPPRTPEGSGPRQPLEGRLGPEP